MRFKAAFAALAAAITIASCAPIDGVNTTAPDAGYGPHLDRRFELMGYVYANWDFQLPRLSLVTTGCHDLRRWTWQDRISSYQIQEWAICDFFMDSFDCVDMGNGHSVLHLMKMSWMMPPEYNDRVKSVRCKFARGYNEWGERINPTA